MPTFAARAPATALSVVLPTAHEGAVPTYTARDNLSGTVVPAKPLKECKVVLRFNYRLCSDLPLFGWNRALDISSEYLETAGFTVATYKGESTTRPLGFGPFPLGATRNWRLGGSTDVGKRYTATVLTAASLPPSFDERWHHAYWNVCVESVDVDGVRAMTTVPIVFLPNLQLASPYAPLAAEHIDSWHSVSEAVSLYSYACLGRVGKLDVTLQWPKPASDLRQADEAAVLVSGVATPVKLILHLRQPHAADVDIAGFSPAAVHLRQQITGSNNKMDDAVRCDALHLEWSRTQLAEDRAVWQANVVVPDRYVSSFECRAFLLAVKHKLLVSLRVPLACGLAAGVDVPVSITRQPGAATFDDELARLARGFTVVDFVAAAGAGKDRSCWPLGPKRTLGKPPVCLLGDDEKAGALAVGLTGQALPMRMRGDGFPTAAAIDAELAVAVKPLPAVPEADAEELDEPSVDEEAPDDEARDDEAGDEARDDVKA